MANVPSGLDGLALKPYMCSMHNRHSLQKFKDAGYDFVETPHPPI